MAIRWREWAARLAAVTPISVGLPGDGLVNRSAGSRLDKPWHELAQEFDDAVDAWRKHPLARRLVGLTTAYTVGGGVSLSSERPEVQRFLADFWSANRMALRVDEWSDELARSGELFPVLFTHPVSGRSTVRTVPAALIERVEVDPDDYEQEARYWQTTGPGEPPKVWVGQAQTENVATPLMLHYAVNRPIGAVRGESDLAAILPWLRRYSRWLEDRVRLNAAMRAFLWIVHAPARLRPALEERYRQPPEPGSVIIAEREVETWQAVTPNLHAGDAEKDGRAIRWMIAAGGPGTALLDLGEGEDSNLATGQAMAEQRRRFLRRRQSYLAWLLSDLAVHAYERYCAATASAGLPITHAPITHADVIVQMPDISPEDNQALATAAERLASSLDTLAAITGAGDAYRRMALRLFTKFLGEPLSEGEFERILQEGRHGQSNSSTNGLVERADNRAARP
jgi:hypothetical protein